MVCASGFLQTPWDANMLLLHSKRRRTIDIMSNTTREVRHIVFLKLRKDIFDRSFQVLKAALFDLEENPGVKY